MKAFTFNDTDKALIRELLTNAPDKIWHDFYRYVFDYGSHSIQLIGEIGEAASQNEADEAIYARIEKVDGKFNPEERSDLVCEGLKIDKLYIVRTKLYFTDHEDYSKNSVKAKKGFNRLKEILIGKKDAIGDLVAGTTGEHEEVNCHPHYALPKSVNSDFVNIIDSGLLIELNGKYLRAYIRGNGYGFPDYEDNHFYTAEDLKQEARYYEFEEVG